MENPQTIDQQNQSKSAFDELATYAVRAVGKIPGPTKRNGQQTFCVVLGLFDKEGSQAVHTKADGSVVPIVLTSYPIDTDDQPQILL